MFNKLFVAIGFFFAIMLFIFVMDLLTGGRKKNGTGQLIWITSSLGFAILMILIYLKKYLG